MRWRFFPPLSQYTKHLSVNFKRIAKRFPSHISHGSVVCVCVCDFSASVFALGFHHFFLMRKHLKFNFTKYAETRTIKSANSICNTPHTTATHGTICIENLIWRRLQLHIRLRFFLLFLRFVVVFVAVAVFGISHFCIFSYYHYNYSLSDVVGRFWNFFFLFHLSFSCIFISGKYICANKCTMCNGTLHSFEIMHADRARLTFRETRPKFHKDATWSYTEKNEKKNYHYF